jgi:hypothetical protein
MGLAEPTRRAWLGELGGCLSCSRSGSEGATKSKEGDGGMGRWGDGEMGSKEWESMESGGVLNFEF